MPRRPELWLPRGRKWSAGAIGISVAVHALLFLVKIGAHLLVPAGLSIDALRRELGTLANTMMVDIALGERSR